MGRDGTTFVGVAANGSWGRGCALVTAFKKHDSRAVQGPNADGDATFGGGKECRGEARESRRRGRAAGTASGTVRAEAHHETHCDATSQKERDQEGVGGVDGGKEKETAEEGGGGAEETRHLVFAELPPGLRHLPKQERDRVPVGVVGADPLRRASSKSPSRQRRVLLVSPRFRGCSARRGSRRTRSRGVSAAAPRVGVLCVRRTPPPPTTRTQPKAARASRPGGRREPPRADARGGR